MKNHDTRNIIRNFHKGNFSETSKRKFAWWLISSGDEKHEKEETLKQLWEESVGSVDIDTLEDLDKIRKKIHRPNIKGSYGWYAVASVVFLMILSIGLHYFDRNKESVQESDFLIANAPYGDIIKLTLEDSTEVILNAGSSMVYPRHFSAERRNVFLTGEACFDVNKEANRPFTVETNSFNVTALGTKFEVDAYSDANSASTTLIEGKTKVVLNHKGPYDNSHDYIMEPNQQLLLNKNTGAVTVCEVDADKTLKWTEGDLIFEGASFQKILLSMERKYGVVFVCEHIERMDGSYYVKFRSDESVKDALDILNRLSHHYQYRIDSDTIFIYPIK